MTTRALEDSEAVLPISPIGGLSDKNIVQAYQKSHI